MITLLLLSGLAVLILGGELLVRGSSRLARRLGTSHLVIGLTVVAFGTSAPELAVSTVATLRGAPAIALGNVVGSNIVNILLILGFSAVLAPLAVSHRLVRIEVPLVIVISGLVFLLALDSVLGRLEGLLLLAGLILYLVVFIRLALAGRTSRAGSAESAEPFIDPASRSPVPSPGSGSSPLLLHLALIAAGLILLIIGSRWLVLGAVELAALVGISSLVVGLTVVAVGTSLPELATSVIAVLRGEREIAVGNILGSNLFNLLAVLGCSAALAPQGIPVPRPALTFDLPVMLIAAAVCLPVFITGRVVSRREGLLFLAGYAAYLMGLFLGSTG